MLQQDQMSFYPFQIYDMHSFCNGLAFILNMKTFTSGFLTRVGSEVDYYNMQHLFTQLRYHVTAMENLTATVCVSDL